MANNERPGVYASYYVTAESIPRSGGVLTLGIAAKAAAGSTRQVQRIISASSANMRYGAHSSMTKMIKTAFLNGCRNLVCACVGGSDADADDYSSAFEALLNTPNVDFIVCDSDDADVHAALKAAMGNGEHYAIGIVAAQGGANELCERASAINDEKILLMDAAPEAAVSFGACLTRRTDPTASLSGTVLSGLDAQEKVYTDTELNTLVRGGVIPVERVQGESLVVRAVTTRTVTDGEYDSSYREVTTVRIINSVIPAVRDALRARFSGGRNNDRTRAAIRTQVILELEKLKKRGLITAYGNVSAVPDTDDPTVCAVSFGFQAAYALEYIELTACVTV